MLRKLMVAAAAVLLSIGIPAPAQAAACGDDLGDWVPTAGSQWVMEAFISGNPQNSTAAFTRNGQLAQTTVVDPAGVFVGLYAHTPALNQLEWFAADLPNTGTRTTYTAVSVTCDGPNVLTASGPVAVYNVGVVGSLYMVRVN